MVQFREMLRIRAVAFSPAVFGVGFDQRAGGAQPPMALAFLMVAPYRRGPQFFSLEAARPKSLP